MKNFGNILLIILILIVFLVVSGALYTVDETEQVVVTQFGKLIGDPITEAGLYWKLPFIQEANYFETRVLEWDGDPNEIPTMEKRNIFVDTTARWRIADPLQFMRSVRTEAGAQTRLDDILDAKTREVISSHSLIEAIRNTNRLLEHEQEMMVNEEVGIGKVAFDSIKKGREELNREIMSRSAKDISEYGIELLDVRIKRINYVDQVTQKVYERMISERKRAAEQFRSEGQGKKAEIEGQMKKDLERIRSEAYRTAQAIIGEADAEATAIYAGAFNNDPEFYSFLKTLESYQKTVGKGTVLLLTTDNEFYSRIEGSFSPKEF